MPLDTMIVIAAVVAAFTWFAVVLAYVDRTWKGRGY